MRSDNLIYSILLIVFSILVYWLYLNWRKFKKRIYGHNQLEIWDYKLLIGYWVIIIISVISAIVFFKEAFKD